MLKVRRSRNRHIRKLLKNNTNRVIFFGVMFIAFRTFIGSFSGMYPLSKGITLVELGIIKSFLSVGIMALDIPTSYFFDKRSYSLPLRLACAAAAINFFLMYFAVDFTDFMVAEFFNALTLALLSGSFSSLLYDISKSEKIDFTVANSVYQKYNNLGMMLTSIFGSAGMFLLQQTTDLENYYAPFYMFSGITFVALFISSFFLLRGERKLLRKRANAEKREAEAKEAEIAETIKMQKEAEEKEKNQEPKEKEKFQTAREQDAHKSTDDDYSMKKLLSLIFQGEDVIKYTMIMIIINSCIGTMIIQSYQGMLFLLDEDVNGFVLMMFFASIMFAQFLSGHFFSRRKIVRMIFKIYILVNAISMLVFWADVGDGSLQILFFGIDIGLMFFVTKYLFIASQSLILNNLKSKLKSSVMSIAGTTSRVISIFSVPIFFMYMKEYHMMTMVPTFFVINVFLWFSFQFVMKHRKSL